ncbi:MAG TPA: hypothetical protein VM840_11610 [Actinomycetota bacterium]|nr:hypothetical protein [Actinomycetota bacterium]
MKTRKALAAVAAAALCAGWALVATPSQAATRDEITIGVGQHFKKSYPAIPAVRPPAPVIPFAQVRPPQCRDLGASSSYCDSFDVVKIEIPDDYRALWLIEVVLTWNRGTTNNDMWLWTWVEDDIDATWGPMAADRDSTAAAKFPPRRVILSEPDPFFITVVNNAGVNAGYTLELIWHETEVDLGGFSRPQVATTSSPFNDPRSSNAPVPTAFNADGSDLAAYDDDRPPPVRTVLVPGPDGAMQKVTLPTIARGDRAAPPQRRFDPVVAAVVAGLLGSGAALAFLAIRRRQAEL